MWGKTSATVSLEFSPIFGRRRLVKTVWQQKPYLLTSVGRWHFPEKCFFSREVTCPKRTRWHFPENVISEAFSTEVTWPEKNLTYFGLYLQYARARVNFPEFLYSKIRPNPPSFGTVYKPPCREKILENFFLWYA